MLSDLSNLRSCETMRFTYLLLLLVYIALRAPKAFGVFKSCESSSSNKSIRSDFKCYIKTSSPTHASVNVEAFIKRPLNNIMVWFRYFDSGNNEWSFFPGVIWVELRQVDERAFPEFGEIGIEHLWILEWNPRQPRCQMVPVSLWRIFDQRSRTLSFECELRNCEC